MVLSVVLWACAEPPRSQIRTPEPPPQGLTQESQVLIQECGGVRVQLTLDRKRQSTSVADLFITDAGGHILSDLSRVVLAFSRKTQANITTTLVARFRETGHYVLMSEFPLTLGPWTIEVIVRRASGSAVSCPFSFDQYQ